MKHGPPIFEDYYAALKLCKINDTILAGMDGNSSMGTNDKNVSGTFGIPHTNDAGRRMQYFLSIRGLTTATTFFQKKTHGTWIHPRSKLPHQLDHIITNKSWIRYCVENCSDILGFKKEVMNFMRMICCQVLQLYN